MLLHFPAHRLKYILGSIGEKWRIICGTSWQLVGVISSFNVINYIVISCSPLCTCQRCVIELWCPPLPPFTCFLPASVEERALGTLDDLSLSERIFPSQDGADLKYSTLISGEINRDGEESLKCRKKSKCTYSHAWNNSSFSEHILQIVSQFARRAVAA